MDEYIMKNKGWYDPRTNKAIDKDSLFYPKSLRGTVTVKINQYYEEKDDSLNSDFILDYENENAITTLYVNDKDINPEIKNGRKYYNGPSITSGYVEFKNLITGKVKKYKLVEVI